MDVLDLLVIVPHGGERVVEEALLPKLSPLSLVCAKYTVMKLEIAEAV
jgi:hypothetical protein